MGVLWAWLAAVTATVPGPISNGLTAVSPVLERGRIVGVNVTDVSGGHTSPVAEIRWSSGARWTCDKVTATTSSLRFSGFATPGCGTPTLSADTFVSVELAPNDRAPRVRFRIGISRFDEARWRKTWQNLCPVYFLRCSLPGGSDKAQMFYQHGLLYPGPEVDAYPITMGPMRGDWSERWSYAPAIGAAPVPSMGLWSPADRLFVAYDFSEPRLGDRSDKYIASSYCAGLPDHPGQFFSLSWPYAEDWGRLRLPKAPVTIASTFRLLYSRDIPSDSDPNRFVLRSIASRHAAKLPPAPKMNDMSWLRQGLEASQTRFLHDIGLAKDFPRSAGAPIVLAPWERCEKVFFEPGAVQLVAHQTGKTCRYAFSVGDRAGLAELKRQIEMLIPRAVEERFGDDVCYVWPHPLEGTFKEGLGGARATGTRHMFNWGIASAMLWFYKDEHDPRYLPFIDGMVRWTRHCLYDRAGMADLPWAVFSMGAANGGEFLLDYYYTFRDDPERRELAQEAWRLADMIVYRNTYPYLGDPIETDTIDPSFLLQAVNSAYWLGAVTWGEMGRVPEMWIRMYLETGDPLLKHLTRGCLEQFYMGTINSAGQYAENLLVFKGGGTSGGWGGNNFRWLAEPLGSAVMQVDVGPKAAIAFCRGTRAVDIDEYVAAPRGNCRFRVVVDTTVPEAPSGPFDIMVTSPHESIAGKTVRLNGAVLSPDRYVVGSDGVNALVRGVRAGDVVAVGDVPAEKQPSAPARSLPVRTAFHALPNADWTPVDIRKAASARIDSLWSGPWGGLVPGQRSAAGVTYCIIDPAANGGRGAAPLAGGLTIGLPGSGPCVVFLGGPTRPKPVFGGTVLARGELQGRKGVRESVMLRYEDGMEVASGMQWYDKEWWIRAFPLGSKDVAPTSVRLSGPALLMAVSCGKTPRAAAVVASMRAKVLRDQRATAYAGIQMPSRVAPIEAPWHADRRYRFFVRVHPGGRRLAKAPLRIRQDLGALMAQVGETGRPDPRSIRAYALGANQRGMPIACQFAPDDPARPERGELLLRWEGDPPRGACWVAVYFAAGTASAPTRNPAAPVLKREGTKAILSNGLRRIVFELSGEGIGPRMVGLEDLSGGGNWLGKSGHDEGFAHLCACQDGVTWYDFGALQPDDATVEVVDSGPLALTVRFRNLRIYGEGTTTPFAGVGTAGPRRASGKGVADWYVRMYTGDRRIDNWVVYTITDPATGWTRPLEVRYAQARPSPGASGGTAGEAGAWARQGPLSIVALDERPEHVNAQPYYIFEDGNIVGVRMTRPDAIGRTTSDRWRIMPPRTPDSAMALEAAPWGIEQFGLEVRSSGRILRRTPQAVASDEDESTDWATLVPADPVAMIEAGKPDVERGLRNLDNPDEGASVRVQPHGLWCIAPGVTPHGAQQAFVYFDVSQDVAERVTGSPVFVAVQYLDIGRATISLHYDSTDESVRKSVAPGAFKDAVGTIRLENTGKRKTSVFALPDPRFSNQCNGSDFRLESVGGPFHILRVAIVPPSP